MVLYFTGTGNSKYVADVIADITGDETVSLNSVIKNNLSLKFKSEKPFVIVAPVYAWRLPIIIEKLVRKAEFSGSNQIYFVATMGSDSGNSDKYCEKIANEKGMTFMGFCGVIMPSNYVASGVMLKTEAAKKVIEEALPVIKSIAKKIKNGNVICKTDKTRMAGIMSGPVNSLFNKYSSNCGYIVSDKCISCGKCADNCVLNNINMENGRPVFGKNCISCYACIHHCPVEAINIKGKTETHGRYVCPEYKK